MFIKSIANLFSRSTLSSILAQGSSLKFYKWDILFYKKNAFSKFTSLSFPLSFPSSSSFSSPLLLLLFPLSLSSPQRPLSYTQGMQEKTSNLLTLTSNLGNHILKKVSDHNIYQYSLDFMNFLFFCS